MQPLSEPGRLLGRMDDCPGSGRARHGRAPRPHRYGRACLDRPGPPVRCGPGPCG